MSYRCFCWPLGWYQNYVSRWLVPDVLTLAEAKKSTALNFKTCPAVFSILSFLLCLQQRDAWLCLVQSTAGVTPDALLLWLSCLFPRCLATSTSIYTACYPRVELSWQESLSRASSGKNARSFLPQKACRSVDESPTSSAFRLCKQETARTDTLVNSAELQVFWKVLRPA